jgi:hypothetical protein
MTPLTKTNKKIFIERGWCQGRHAAEHLAADAAHLMVQAGTGLLGSHQVL